MRSKKKKNGRWRLLTVVLILAIIGLIVPINFTRPARNFVWVVLGPPSKAIRSSLGRSIPFFKDILSLKRIVKQNHDLVIENLSLQSRLAQVSETAYENEVLKKELGFMKNQTSSQMIPAAIIGQSSGYLKSLVIDKGKNANLSLGDSVVSQGILVGVVTDLRENNSEITLITDFNSLVPVVLQETRGTGLLRGGLDGLAVEDIPLNNTIKEGENVVTSGLGGQIPAGILVGKASDIISKEGEIFQKVAVSSSIDFSKLEVLFIVRQNE